MTHQRILANVTRDEFIGRDAELRQLVSQSSRPGDSGGLLLLGAPNVGASELLRQAYDELFSRRGEAIPIYFAFGRASLGAARSFFQSFIQQYIAYRRVDPALCEASLTFHDLVELALPTDYELISELIEGFERERASTDPSALVSFCLSAPQRVAAAARRSVFPLIDCVRLAGTDPDQVALGREIARAFKRSDGPVALAGLRRQILDVVHGAGDDYDSGEVIHVEELSDDDARRLVASIARRQQVESNEETRDLIVQQLGASPFFINAVLQAARERETPLTSFLNCQRLYVDELMGGRIHRHFASILDQVAPQTQTRRTLLRVLHESASSETRKSSLWAWKKRLGVDATEFERIIDALHVYELANSSAAFVEANAESYVWMDYLRAHYRIEVAGESRALVVADTLIETLKRAPQAMARKYRREAALGLRQLLGHFNCQRVPASLFHYDRFAAAHTGVETEAVNAALDAEADLIKLPQVVHVAAGSALAASMQFEEERCAVGHGFDAADYRDETEIVWVAAQIESKLEASRELTEEWCNRLSALARECGFGRVRLWLVAQEGFSPEACELLNERDAYGSSRRQVELLTERIKSEARALEESRPDEYEMVIPMGTDTELIAAHTVEQIARRVNFRPEAINQIKTALVEACINAAEHSLSPDRKIYQRFRVENDKLVVTVASRGVVPANVRGQNGEGVSQPEGKSRRGWGLKLIKTLMDEVEFERVDDGTQLRMTKYIR
ncbi:MAG TPA: ATP-binding protein [Pyrinomonadaceae bacterium]|nr:ATP-binding protein [Pyrinomonadaceae bacterium]